MNKKAKTPDGRRTPLSALNTGVAADQEPPPARGVWGRLKRFIRNLNLVMAGMYTGLNCYGTPNTEHSYDEGEQATADKPGRAPNRNVGASPAKQPEPTRPPRKASSKQPDRRPI